MKTTIVLICFALSTIIALAQNSTPAGKNHLPKTTIYIIDGERGDYMQAPLLPEPQKPLINIDVPSSNILTGKEIEQLPYTNVRDMISLFPGVYQRQLGGDISISGSRMATSHFIIDGMQ